MAGRGDALRYLQSAFVVIRRVIADGEDPSGREGREAWGELKVGMSKAGGEVGSILEEVTDDPVPLLVFVADFTASKRMYRSQAESILDKLLRLPSFVSAVQYDSDLRARLRAVGEKTSALLGDEASYPPDEENPGPRRKVARAESDDTGRRASANSENMSSLASGCSSPPLTAAGDPDISRQMSGLSQWMNNEVGPCGDDYDGIDTVPEDDEDDDVGELGLFMANCAPGATFLTTASFMEPFQDSAAASAAAAALAADETKRMLRESFADIVAQDYEVFDDRGSTENAMEIFAQLYTATNRAHFEHQRTSRSRADMMLSLSPDTFCGSGTFVDMPSAGGTFVSAAASSAWASPRSRECDYLADALADGQCDPRRTLMFLMNLAKQKPMYRKRIEHTAQLLTQVSATCRGVARGDAFLTARLGACRGPEDAAEVVSYGFASNLRWACWDATKYWVYQRRKEESKAAYHLEEWIRREHALKELSELPRLVLGELLVIAWEAAQHAAVMRWPEEPRRMRAWLREKIVNFARPPEDNSPHKEEFHAHCEVLTQIGALTEELQTDLKWMLWNTAWYVASKSKNYAAEAREALVRAERHLQRAFRGEAQWRGVNLGGWFLLQPGASKRFWDALPKEARVARCEWAACEALEPDVAQRMVREHRRTYFSKRDFEDIKASGLSHVRLPIGAWCVLGPGEGEPYVGPCFEELDRALDLIEAEGLRVVLDLHGAVGGENAEAASGHEHRDWNPRKWDMQASILALEVLAKRYVHRHCVCGIGVCNEPCMRIPAKVLAKYYERAVQTVRAAGMRAGEVAVLLPIYSELRTPEFLDLWEASYPKYEDCVFDFHLKQCFGQYWTANALDRHMEAAKARATLLRSVPMCCVSEWSLALPSRALVGFDKQQVREAHERFARLQLEAFETATHGWFFWTWKSHAGLPWSLRDLLRKRVLEVPGGVRSNDF